MWVGGPTKDRKIKLGGNKPRSGWGVKKGKDALRGLLRVLKLLNQTTLWAPRGRIKGRRSVGVPGMHANCEFGDV